MKMIKKKDKEKRQEINTETYLKKKQKKREKKRRINITICLKKNKKD